MGRERTLLQSNGGFAGSSEQDRTVSNRPSFSRNATPQEQALDVGFRQELLLNLRHRNDGFVPKASGRHRAEPVAHTLILLFSIALLLSQRVNRALNRRYKRPSLFLANTLQDVVLTRRQACVNCPQRAARRPTA